MGIISPLGWNFNMVMVDALKLLLDPLTLGVMLACGVYGLVVGAIPGFTATMAVALLVPVTYFLEPVPALAGIVTLAAMAILELRIFLACLPRFGRSNCRYW